MNCIFICVFHQKQYVDMFYLLLESITKYGELQDDCEILVYTNTEFMKMIMQNCDNTKIKFAINDGYSSIEKACKARLDYFSLKRYNFAYAKVLYLDTDIIITKPIAHIFDICEKDLLYVLEEGLLTWNDDYYGGKSLFNNDFHEYEDISAFTSGILLFKNCDKIRWLFDKIKEDIIARPFALGCHDQPYFVYAAFKYAAYDNKIMKKYCVNNDFSIHSDKIIYHFPGGPGLYANKLKIMTNFLQDMRNARINMSDDEHLSHSDKCEIMQIFGGGRFALITFPEIENEFLDMIFIKGIPEVLLCMDEVPDNIYIGVQYVIILKNNDIGILKKYDVSKISNTNIIYKIHYNILNGKIYSWESSYIKFLPNGRMEAFGNGHYYFVNEWTIYASFGGREHTIAFDNEYISFISTRRDDGQEIRGCITIL
jgi:hypothetical protein